MSVAYLSASPPMSYSVQGFFAHSASRDPFRDPYSSSSRFVFNKMGTERLLYGHQKISKLANGKKYASILRQHSYTENGGAKSSIECQEVAENSAEAATDAVDASKQKKKVSFADNFGLNLTMVRVMSEPSDMPPKLGIQAFADILKSGEADRPPQSTKRFTLLFDQPGGDYLALRKRLEEKNVSLENAVVEPSKSGSGHRILGTVKVRNLSFEKSVHLRFTHDDWQTYEDVPACYVSPNNGESTNSSERYDTFSFLHDIPDELRGQLQFCVRFECADQTYWDNNNGQNYVAVQSKTKSDVENEYQQLDNDIRHLRVSHSYTWTNFSYWRSGLEDERPYWITPQACMARAGNAEMIYCN